MTLTVGSTGVEVIALQALLNNRGYSKVHADGKFGALTLDAVKDFQKHIGFTVDGVVTDYIFNALRGAGPVPIKGIDVSHWQQNINWNKVKTAGVGFCYIKSSEGNTRREAEALKQGPAAKSVGIPIGYYHFSSLNDPNVVNDADQEAISFDAAMRLLPSYDLIPVLDIETNKSNLSPDLVQRWITEFRTKLASLGHRELMIYSYTPFIEQYLPAHHPFGDMPLWLAQYRDIDYPKMPHGWTSYTVWQYSASGTVSGISGNVDLNKCLVLPLVTPPSV